MGYPAPSRKYFGQIWKMRYDEVPQDLKVELLEEVVFTLTTFVTWNDRCEHIKKVWSRVHNQMDVRRRNK